MKKLVLVTLTAVLAMQLTGCIITTEGDDGPPLPPDEALITANWSINQIGGQQDIPCPPNITTAAVYSQPLDTNYNPVGDEIIDLFDCDDGTGVTDPLPADVYQVQIALTSEGGATVFARSTIWKDGMDPRDRNDVVDVLTSDKEITVSILENGGYFGIEWELIDSLDDQPMTCAEAMATGVSAVSTSVATPSEFVDDVFNCEAGYGITGGMLEGDYTIDVEAIDSSESPISTTPTTANKVIQAANRVTEAGLIEISVD